MIQFEEKKLAVIRKNIPLELRKKITRIIMCAELSGYVSEGNYKTLIKDLKIVCKTRSKRHPYMATEYGRMIMYTTREGKAYLELGTK